MTKDMTTGAITPLLDPFYHSPRAGQFVPADIQRRRQHHRGQIRGRGRPRRRRHLQSADDAGHPLHQRHVPGCGHSGQHRVWRGRPPSWWSGRSPRPPLGTVFSLAFSLLCILLANPLLRLLQVPAEILPIAVNYLRIVFAGLIFTFFYNFLAATLRALGDSKSALYFLMISAVLNIGGDLFFVKVLNWGRRGLRPFHGAERGHCAACSAPSTSNTKCPSLPGAAVAGQRWGCGRSPRGCSRGACRTYPGCSPARWRSTCCGSWRPRPG